MALHFSRAIVRVFQDSIFNVKNGEQHGKRKENK